MSSPTSDLKIADYEHLHAEQFLIVYLDHLVDAGEVFTSVMDRVGQEAVQDGQHGIAQVCYGHGATMRDIVSDLASVRDNLRGSADAFVATIDEIDQFMY